MFCLGFFQSRILFAANINTSSEEYEDSKSFNSKIVYHHNDHDYAMQINNIKMDEEEDLPLHSELKFKKAPFFRRIKILGLKSYTFVPRFQIIMHQRMSNQTQYLTLI